MAKRRKTIYAGRLVYDVVYTVASPRDTGMVRRKKRQISTAAVERINCNTATRKLELLLAANFEPDDLVVTFTYRDADLPPDYQHAQRRVGKFLRELRSAYARKGQELRYIYVTEGKHGDHRLHHHIVLPSTGNDIETFRGLWQWGDQIEIRYIHDKKYDGWAQYLSKERRDASLNGKRMYVPSRNLCKPVIEYEWVDDATTIEAPPGATEVVESGDRNEFASYKYLKYLLPKKANAFLSGSKPSITYRHGRKKQERTVDRR